VDHDFGTMEVEQIVHDALAPEVPVHAVDGNDLVALFELRAEMRADETRRSGDENLHAASETGSGRRRWANLARLA
jgi:hypothetical protein